jgi:hypothetical protein
LAFALLSAAIGFLTIIIGLVVGIAVGEVIVRASGGFKDPIIVKIAAAAASAGVLFPLVLNVISNPKLASSPYAFWTIIAAAAAAYGAGSRAN